MTDQQKKAVEEAAKNYAHKEGFLETENVKRLIFESFESGALEALNNPEKYGLAEYHVMTKVFEFRIERIYEENARLRGGLEHAINAMKAINSFSATRSIINTLEKALKGDNTCKP